MLPFMAGMLSSSVSESSPNPYRVEDLLRVAATGSKRATRSQSVRLMDAESSEEVCNSDANVDQPVPAPEQQQRKKPW